MQFVEAPNNFYLGARVDPDTGQVIEGDIVYYDARDLTTHGIVVGMTGSGKTGLCIDILEEAVIDGIPSIVIDPKGDITNLLLAFPQLTPDNFQPWVNADDALRADHTLEEHAATVADRWKQGLSEWGITETRIQQFRRGAQFSIYTPGSESGLPINILQSLAAPAEGWAGNEEMLRERISGTVTALLALIGIDAKPVEDREHILLSNIFEFNWRNNTSLSLEQLILQVQKPPFTKMGVFEVERIFPEKDRLKLSQALNNIIAAPQFQSWIQGEPLHIPSLLYTPEGYPRVSIFYIAHLNDAERAFIVTLLLEAVLAWMRTLSGTTSLRSLLYIDEVFGMFPPHPYNPPTKQPIMRLLKQARAFGVGVLMATQNPKDLDYKGLSNAGTWLIGKLQTENDKQRILEGLDSARDANSVLDVRTVDRLISNLGPRQFILHNVHETTGPVPMTTRWTMSYLRGPLTRQQIAQLMANQKGQVLAAQTPAQPMHQAAAAGATPHPQGFAAQPSAAASTSAPFHRGGQPASPDAGGGASAPPPTYSTPSVDTAPQATSSTGPLDTKDAPPGFSAIPPILSSSVYQFYVPTDVTVERALRDWEQWTRQPAMNVQTRKRLLYRPALLAQVNVRFTDRKSNTAEQYIYAFVVPNLPRTPYLDWYEYQTDPFDPYSLDPNPFAEAFYAELPTGLSGTSNFNTLKTNLTDWLYQNAHLITYQNEVLKVYGGIGEDYQTFLVKVQAIARQKRDEEIEKVGARYDKQLATLEARLSQKDMRRRAEADELDARKREELLSAGESLLRMTRGRGLGYTLSRTSRLRRYTSTSQDQLAMLDQQLGGTLQQMEATQYEMEQALQAVSAKWSEAAQQNAEVRITPNKKDIHPTLFGIGWVPYWDVMINNQPFILPASTSSLTQVQEGSGGGGGDYYQSSQW